MIGKLHIPDTLNHDLVRAALSWVQRGYYVQTHTHAIEEMKSTGLISEIDNGEVKNSINDYYRSVNWVFGELPQSHRSNAVFSWRDYLLKEYHLTSERLARLDAPIDFIKENEIFALRLESLAGEVAWVGTNLYNRINQAEELISLLEKEMQ